MKLQEYLDENYTQKEQLELTSLKCNTNVSINITSLKGIENLINLEVLQITNNNLTSLKGIENLINLKELHCSNNNLTSLEGIENLINLKELSCSYNNLTSLEGIENLGNLWILNQNIEHFDITIDELRQKYKTIARKRKIQNVLID